MAEVYKDNKYTMIFGNNTFRNCNGIVIYKPQHGKQEELFRIEKDLGLLLSASIRDSKGKLIGKLFRNSFVCHEKGFDAKKYFEMKTTPIKFAFVRKKDGKEIFAAEIKEGNVVVVTGEFFIGGIKIEATNEQLSVGKNILKNCTFNGCGTGILIDDFGFALGTSYKK